MLFREMVAACKELSYKRRLYHRMPVSELQPYTGFTKNDGPKTEVYS
jgi:hypothetical protein